MKTLKSIIALLFVLIVFLKPLQAQSTFTSFPILERNNGMLIRFDNLAVDSNKTVWTQTIDATHYDNAIRYYTYTSGTDTAYRTNTTTVDTGDVSASSVVKDTLYSLRTFTISDLPSYGFKVTSALGTPNLTIRRYVCYGNPTVNANWIADDVVVTITDTAAVKGTWGTSNTKAPYEKYSITNAPTGRPGTLAGGIYLHRKD